MLSKMVHSANKVLAPVNRIVCDFCTVVIVLVTLLVVLDVLFRRMFSSPIIGVQELTTLGFSMIVFLPLAWCTFNDGHIELDVLFRALPKKAQLIIQPFNLFLATIIVVIMSWQIFVQGAKLQAGNEATSLLGIPIFPFLYLAGVGSFLLAVTFFIKFLKSLCDVMEARG